MGLYGLDGTLDPVQKGVGAVESSSVVEAHGAEQLLGLEDERARPGDASRSGRFQGSVGAISGMAEFPPLCRSRSHNWRVDWTCAGGWESESEVEWCSALHGPSLALEIVQLCNSLDFFFWGILERSD